MGLPLVARRGAARGRSPSAGFVWLPVRTGLPGRQPLSARWVAGLVVLVGSVLAALPVAARAQDPVAAAEDAEPSPARPLRAAAARGEMPRAASDGDGPTPPDRPGTRVAPTAPELFYVEDDAGRLVPVPGFAYGDFVEMVRLRQGLPGAAQPPAAVLESLTVTLHMPAGGVRDPGCLATVDAAVRQTRAGWSSLPLDLGGLVLDAPPRHEGEGAAFIDVDAPAPGPAEPAARDVTAALLNGYRAWFQGPADGRHRLQLGGRITVEAAGEEQAVWLRLPAATASAVVILTDRQNPLVAVTPGGVDPRIEPDGSGGSRVTCVGLVGPTRIRIGPRGTPQASAGAAPEATVESVVRIDGRMAAWQTLVSLRDLPVDMTRITVTLPPGATPRAVRGGTVANRETRGGDGDATQPVERLVVDVARSADGRAALEIDAERSIDPQGRALEPLGFMVEPILPWRQHGRVSLLVEGDWQLEWDDAGRNRRVDPPAAARRPGLSAAFAYDAQPATLPIHVRPRGSRVVVEPEYRYSVDSGRLGLEARLRLSVRGAPVNRIAVGLDGWGIDDVSPTGLVDTAAIRAEGGLLLIPFLQPLAGDATIEIRCGRTLERDARRLAWTLPVPQADLVAPASVSVSAANDIEVVPDVAAIRGLVRQTAPSARREEGERAVLTYRLDGTDGEFAADRRYLAQRIEAVVATAVTIGGDGAVVEETIRYDVAHVALESIDVVVPAAVADGGTLELRQGGQPLNPFPAPAPGRGAAGRGDPAPPADGTGTVNLRALLPQPLLGTGDLTIRYEVPMVQVPAEATASMDLPLVLPAEGRVSRQSLSLLVDGPLVVDVRGDTWERDTLQGAGARAWTSGRPQAVVPLAVSARQGMSRGDTVVEAAWFETRLLPDGREDLCTYTVSSSSRRFELTVPGAWRPAADRQATLEVRVDGRPVPAAVRPGGRMTVELPSATTESAGRGAWIVSIECRRGREAPLVPGWPRVAGWVGPLVLEPPEMASGVVQRRFYWELRLLADEHVVLPPRPWTSQQRWAWSGLGFERRPVVSRGALARWLEANRRAATDRPAEPATPVPLVAAAALDPPLAERRAVWSGIGAVEPSRVWVVPTWLLVLLASGPVLGVGLRAVYRAGARQPAVVVGAATLAVTAAALNPELAPLVAQAALPGVALTALAASLRWLVERPVPTASAPRPSLVVSPQSSTRLVVTGDSARLPVVVDPPTAAGRAVP